MSQTNLFCTNHPDQKIEWFCLESECPKRLLCSKCAIQIHEKWHKVEELNNLSKCNLQSFLQSNEQLNTEKYENQLNEVTNQVAEFIQSCWASYNNKYESLILLEKIPNFSVINNEIQQQMQQFDSIINQKQPSQEQLKSLIDGQLKTIYAQLSPNLTQSGNIELFKNQKMILVSKLNEQFFSLLKAFFSTPFMTNCLHLYELQLQTLNELKIDNSKDAENFLEFLEAKWLQDYQKILQSIELNTDRMKKDLNSTLYQDDKVQNNSDQLHQSSKKPFLTDEYLNSQEQQPVYITTHKQKKSSPIQTQTQKMQTEWPNYPEQPQLIDIRETINGQQNISQVYKNPISYQQFVPTQIPLPVIQNYQITQQQQQQQLQQQQQQQQQQQNQISQLKQGNASPMIHEQLPDYFQGNHIQIKSQQNPHSQIIYQERTTPQHMIIQESTPQSALIQQEKTISKTQIIQQQFQPPSFHQFQINSPYMTMQQPMVQNQQNNTFVEGNSKQKKDKIKKKNKKSKNKQKHEERIIHQQLPSQIQFQSLPFQMMNSSPQQRMPGNPFQTQPFQPSPFKQVFRQQNHPF